MGKRKQRQERRAHAAQQATQTQTPGTSPRTWGDTGPGGSLALPLARDRAIHTRTAYTARPPFQRYTGPRDPITGEPLRDGTPRLRVCLATQDGTQDGTQDESAETSRSGDGTSCTRGVPLTIDTSRPYPGGSHGARLGRYLGGLQWSPAFGAYIAPALPPMIASERCGWRQWWLSAYVVSRLRGPLGSHVVDALLAIYCDHADWYAEAARLQHSVSWLARKATWAFALARQFWPRNSDVTAKVAAAA